MQQDLPHNLSFHPFSFSAPLSFYTMYHLREKRHSYNTRQPKKARKASTFGKSKPPPPEATTEAIIEDIKPLYLHEGRWCKPLATLMFQPGDNDDNVGVLPPVRCDIILLPPPLPPLAHCGQKSTKLHCDVACDTATCHVPRHNAAWCPLACTFL